LAAQRGTCSSVVVIGRNEGERLGRCLQALAEWNGPRVYVDSGSSDGSPELAREMGWDVVELDPRRPFTAARGRNEGLEYLLSNHPYLEFVQFVDGDCQLVDGWLEKAEGELRKRLDAAIVCGQLRELHPERSIYNLLCDLEWRRETGEVASCGGIFMARVAALKEVGGFNPLMIAGEEGELCLRLRRSGWKILRLPDLMAYHDAAMTRFRQWWKRSVRTGYGYAESALMHGLISERHNVRPVCSILLWGLVVPALAVGLAIPTGGLGLALIGVYFVPLLRAQGSFVRRGWKRGEATLYAAFCVLSKFPQALGLLRYIRRGAARRRKRRHSLQARLTLGAATDRAALSGQDR